jgi:hypothetical protein
LLFLGKVPRYTLSKQLDTVKGALLKDLKDPDSAKFGIIAAGTAQDGSILICGMVDTRNGFGGYTGELPFQATIVKGAVTRLFISTTENAAFINQSRRNRGVFS